MRAITTIPGQKGSLKLREVDEPRVEDGPIVVEGVAMGLCGTDVEIASADYGWAPPGQETLTLGHESLGRVLEAPEDSGFAKGDLVVGIVRRPDPEPCTSCAVGEWDMCRNGKYTERGIKELDGFGSERWRIKPEYLVKVDPKLGLLGVLLEPASVLAKAWEQVERIGRRAHWAPKRVLVTGAGPIGLIAALMGVQRGLEVHVLDRVESGLKPKLVERLGAKYHTGKIGDAVKDADVVIECTGVGQVVIDAMQNNAPGGIVCLTGVASSREVNLDAGMLNRVMVLENDVVVGSVNANKRHYQLGAGALAEADRDWLGALLTRRVPLSRFEEAFVRQPDDVKTVIELTT
ncbi:MAG: glucose 1-dehydrogenase [Polyangiales bacterium]